jgi:hypothetical protein
LSDFEATIKDTEGNYLELCNVCYGTIKNDIDAEIRYDLMSEGDEYQQQQTELIEVSFVVDKYDEDYNYDDI